MKLFPVCDVIRRSELPFSHYADKDKGQDVKAVNDKIKVSVDYYQEIVVDESISDVISSLEYP